MSVQFPQIFRALVQFFASGFVLPSHISRGVPRHMIQGMGEVSSVPKLIGANDSYLLFVQINVCLCPESKFVILESFSLFQLILSNSPCWHFAT